MFLSDLYLSWRIATSNDSMTYPFVVGDTPSSSKNVIQVSPALYVTTSSSELLRFFSEP